MKVKIIDIDHKGNGIAKVDNKIMFVPKSITGDFVNVDIVKNRRKYDEAIVREVIVPSDLRIDSLCPYYNICGGCNISNLSYNDQLEYKKNKVINIFKKYLNIDINPDIIGSDQRYEYRNKITYQIKEGKIGLVSINNDVVSIDKCLLVSDKVNELYELICKEDLSLVERIIIKECDNGLILGIYGKIKFDNLKDRCLSIYMNDLCMYKKEEGYIFINDTKYVVSMDSFFQINTANISNLYDVVVQYGEFNKEDKVIDLYCGVGSISLYVSGYVKSVFGMEIIPDAIRDAKENAKLNNISNVEFICGDVSKLIDNNICGNKIIVDPPRVGLDTHTIEVLNKVEVDNLIYVSCDPLTLVRDLNRLDCYKLEKITLVDMFPQTHHVECVCLLNSR